MADLYKVFPELIPQVPFYKPDEKEAKMSSLSIRYANEALRGLKHLKDEDGDYFQTVQSIANNMRDANGQVTYLDPSKHQKLRLVLERLYHAGAIDRIGASGHYKWKINVSSWSAFDPFKKVGGGGPAPVVSEQDDLEGVYELQQKIKEKDNQLKVLTEGLAEGKAEIEELTEEIKELRTKVDENAGKTRTVIVKRYDGTSTKLKDVILPKVYDRVLKLAECRRNILLVGPAGCGKTYLAKLVADTLGLDFSSISCTAGMTEAHLLGRAVPDLTKGTNRFQGTDFLKVYEKGGLALLDEFDAADANLVLALNSGLANGYMNVPNRPDDPRAIKHKNFVCVATANTFGRGATRMYSGRNQLDEATLDRFRIGVVECGYDEGVERVLCPDEGEGWTPPKEDETKKDETVTKLIAKGMGLRGTCQFIRYQIERGGMRRIMSTRFMEDAWVMMSQGEWSLATILETFLEGWSTEEKAKLVG